MYTNTPLSSLHVLPIRYRRSVLAPRDERSVNAYAASGVYNEAAVPVTVNEPRIDPAQRGDDEPANIGLLGGAVADLVAKASGAGAGVLMTGGDCTHISGIIGGLQDAHGPRVRIGLVWFDAHGDFNTPHTSLSGMLGGMPVAVCAGLAYPRWREASHIVAPLPTDRIVMVDVRNLDPAEEALIRATDVTITAIDTLHSAVADLAERCDLLYLHIDSDILDARYVPNHGTVEGNGPDMPQVQAAIDVVMATGKVAVTAVVSVYGEGDGYEVSQASGVALVQGCLGGWKRYGGVF